MSRIARVEAWPVNVPLEATYLMASGVVPGISRTVVRVTTDDGVVGLGRGRVALGRDAASLTASSVRGSSAATTAELLAELGGVEPPPVEHRTDAKVLIRNPLAGVEIALWDIAAREQELPLHALLGGRCPGTGRVQRVLRLPARVRGFSDGRRRVLRADGRGARLAGVRGQGRRPSGRGRRSSSCGRCRSRSGRTARCASTRTWAGGSRPHAARSRSSSPSTSRTSRSRSARSPRWRSCAASTAIPFSAHTPDVALAAELGVPTRSCSASDATGYRGHAALDRRLRGGGGRLLVLQRRPRHRDRRVSPRRRRHAVPRPPEPVAPALDDATT